jgi:transcriptional regulator NrdR family protein
MVKIKVVKRDKSQESFDPEKIVRVVIATGLSDHQAQILLKNIINWLESLNQKTVSTLEIKNQVALELAKFSQYSSNLYKWYENTK